MPWAGTMFSESAVVGHFSNTLPYQTLDPSPQIGKSLGAPVKVVPRSELSGGPEMVPSGVLTKQKPSIQLASVYGFVVHDIPAIDAGYLTNGYMRPIVGGCERSKSFAPNGHCKSY